MADQLCHQLSKVRQLNMLQAILAVWSHQAKQPLAPACPKDAGEASAGLKWGIFSPCSSTPSPQGQCGHSKTPLTSSPLNYPGGDPE